MKCQCCNREVSEVEYMDLDGLCMWCAEAKEFRDAKNELLKAISEEVVKMVKWIQGIIYIVKIGGTRMYIGCETCAFNGRDRCDILKGKRNFESCWAECNCKKELKKRYDSIFYKCRNTNEKNQLAKEYDKYRNRLRRMNNAKSNCS